MSFFDKSPLTLVKKKSQLLIAPTISHVSKKMEKNHEFNKLNIMRKKQSHELLFNEINKGLFAIFPKENKINFEYIDSLEDYELFTSIENPVIDPTQIVMGEMKDYNFISVIVALSESPTYIMQIFQTLSKPKGSYNIYAIWINHQGEWKNFIVDSLLPSIKKKKKFSPQDLKSPDPNNSSKNVLSESKRLKSSIFKNKITYCSYLSGTPEYWLSLLEKAYALACGGYLLLNWSLVEDVFYDLTGAPVESTDFEGLSEIQLGELLLRSFNKGHPILLNSLSYKKRLNNLYAHKFSEGFAHPIVEVRSTKTEYILVKLRRMNSFTYEGDYHRSSPKWPYELRTELSVNLDNNDLIWMSIYEIKKKFESLTVCRINNNCNYESVPLNFKKDDKWSYATFVINSENQTSISVSLCQKDWRSLRDSDPKNEYKYSPVTILISKTTDNGVQFIKGFQNTQRDVSIDFLADKCKYLVYIEISWFSELSRETTVNFYSEERLNPIKLDPGKYDYLLLLSNIFKDIAATNKKPASQKAIKYTPQIILYHGTIFNFTYIYLRNRSFDDEQITGSIELIYTNFFFLPTCKISSPLLVSIDPHEEVVLIGRPEELEKPWAIDPVFKLEVRKSEKEMSKNYTIPTSKRESVSDRDKNKSFVYTDKMNYVVEMLAFDLSKIEEIKQPLFMRLTDINQLLKFIKTQSKICQRKLHKELVNAYVYIAAFPDGLILMFENKTKDLLYKESSRLTVENLKYISPLDYENSDIFITMAVNPSHDKEVSLDFTIAPNEFKIFRMRATSSEKEFYYNISSFYEIFDPKIEKKERPSFSKSHQILKSKTYIVDEFGVEDLENSNMRSSFRGKSNERLTSGKQRSFIVRNTEDFEYE